VTEHEQIKSYFGRFLKLDWAGCGCGCLVPVVIIGIVALLIVIL
jgi:hypothetical protein